MLFTALLAPLVKLGRATSLGLCVFIVANTARAHDPAEAWTTATVRSDELELVVTMAQVTALRLIDPELKARALTAENFLTHRPRLEHEAIMLFALTSGEKPLMPRSVEVELTDENDVVFKIICPRPAPGPLLFRAAFLKKLGDGYGSFLEASDTLGNHLGWDHLSFESPTLEVKIPPAPPQTKP